LGLFYKDIGKYKNMSNEETIVDDGPLSKEYWKEENKIKVLHLLKEPTENKYGSIPDLVEKDGIRIFRSKSKLFRISAIRSYCIQKNCPQWSEIKVLDKQILLCALKKSAIVNLSQICINAQRTPPGKVFEFAQNNYDRWFGKLEKCKPNIVICGGTFDAVLKPLKIKDEDIKYTSTGMRCFKTIGALFLDCYHPSSYKCKECMEYTYFAESIADLFEQEKEFLGVI